MKIIKRIDAEFPYHNYYLYVVFHKKEGRYYAMLVPKDKTKYKRITISYARYIMSVHQHRFLLPSEHVDHIDNNKTNDVIENLQILSLKQNNQKEVARKGGRALVELKCPNCGKLFIKEKKNSFLKGSKIFNACSRECACAFYKKYSQNPSNIEVQKAIKEMFIRELRSTEIINRTTT